MDAKIISWYVGVSLLMVAALMIVSGLIACFTPGDDSVVPLLYSAFVTLVAGAFPLIFVRRGKHLLTAGEGNCIVVLAWVAACLFGSLPFMLYGKQFTPVGALFESVSGFTTTGASILTDIEALPNGIQFWRVATSWVGGMGIVTLFAMIAFRGKDRNLLFGSEISTVARQTVSGERTGFFAYRMLVTYLVLTLSTFVALRLAGMERFDAIINAMSACCTCGFSSRSASIAGWQNPAAEVVLTVAMMAAGINFVYVYLTFVRGSYIHVLKSEVARTFIFLVGLATVAITVDLAFHEGGFTFGTLRRAGFQAVSISTTTGFATEDTTTWPPLSMAILLVCSVICGCSGSTSGGIKIDRIILAVKGVRERIVQAMHPGRMVSVKVDGATRPDDQVNEVFAYIFCYNLVIILFSLINMAGGLSPETGFTASIACIGNVGPGFGAVGSMANYAAVPDGLKFTCMLEMLLGRLEIFPMLSLFASFRRRG